LSADEKPSRRRRRIVAADRGRGYAGARGPTTPSRRRRGGRATRCARAAPHTRWRRRRGAFTLSSCVQLDTRGDRHTHPWRTQYYNTRRGGLSAIILYTRGYRRAVRVRACARVPVQWRVWSRPHSGARTRTSRFA